MSDLYKKLSDERKRHQKSGQLPEWYTTGGWQMFKSKYLFGTDSFLGQASRIAATAAQHTYDPDKYQQKFFELIWNGWLSCSTPVLSNMGTNRGLPVSCSGGFIPDSIDGFYTSRRETALLTKYGFGTSGYLGAIRNRGSDISVGGKASGILPVIRGFVQDSQDVSQGSTRRGAWAGYVEITHGDFWELITYLENNPDDLNIGWIIDDAFVQSLQNSNEEAIKRYQQALKVKMVTGKGYFFFKDKVNRHRPQSYKDFGLEVKASNLCNEINLFSDENHTFTCVLSSLNLAKWEEWEDTDAIETAIHFLDCVAEEFIQRAKNIPGLEKAVEFTQKGRALGLGVCGYHTLLQQNRLPWGSLQAGYLNQEIFETIKNRAEAESKRLGAIYGVPKWGGDRRNSHLIAIAPTKSTALLMGGVSEGINPDPAMTYTQTSAGGEINRVNPVLLEIMKERKVFSKKHIDEIVEASGSVQGVSWLTDEEKQVFLTAFEIDQFQILRHASQRSKYIDQWQSLNLFFSSEESEEYISAVHKQAFLDENIRGLYYVYSMAGVKAAKDECLACQ